MRFFFLFFLLSRGYIQLSILYSKDFPISAVKANYSCRVAIWPLFQNEARWEFDYLKKGEHLHDNRLENTMH